VLRDRWEADLAPPAVPTAVHLRLTLDLSTIEWDRPLAEDLFAFQPPEGSRLVHAFTPPTAMLYGDSLSAVASLPCCVTGPAPAGVFRVGGGVAAPGLLRKVEPQYSEEARQAGYQGTVLLYVQVDPSGKPVNMRVLHSLGLGLDQKAIEAVQKWQFKPGTKDGVPVTVEAQVEVNFRLLGPWRITRQEYDTAAVTGATKPVVQSASYPPNCKGDPASVTLSLLVGADGKPSNVQVIRSSNASFEQPAVEAVKRWMFLPAQLNGTPQAVSGELDLECTASVKR